MDDGRVKFEVSADQWGWSTEKNDTGEYVYASVEGYWRVWRIAYLAGVASVRKASSARA